MTNEEEKILEEENDITLEDAAEEADELQEETQDEGRAIEIPVERREDANLEEILERQVLRGGLRGAADPNMIQKHIDNFLAMLCGETPVDSNVRTSAEYWLKRLATGEGSGSTKKIYWHTIYFQRGGTEGQPAVSRVRGFMVVLNNSSTPLTSDSFLDLLKTPGFVGVVINGYGSVSGGTTFVGTTVLTRLSYVDGNLARAYYIDPDTMAENNFSITIASGWVNITDLGANPIN